MDITQTQKTPLGRYLIKQKAELYLGTVTWIGVMLLTFNTWLDPINPMPALTAFNISLAVTLFLGFYLCFFMVDAKLPFRVSDRQKLCYLGIATLFVIALSLLFYYGFVAILSIIIVSQLTGLLSPKYILTYAITMPIIGAAIDGGLKDSPTPVIGALLYIMFNLFAFLASQRFNQERIAKNHSKQLVRELKATQLLLSAATKRDERLRIARDLHDVVGHHLTALGLQLEVASHLAEGQAQTHIQQARDISRLLLTDVRHAVSEIRASKPLDLKTALETLMLDIPGLKTHLDISPQLQLNHARFVEVIFRCVQEALTNTLKHSNATKFWVTIKPLDEDLYIQIEDNGENTGHVVSGNGLTGMQERVEQIDGELSWKSTPAGFKLNLNLPYAVNGMEIF